MQQHLKQEAAFISEEVEIACLNVQGAFILKFTGQKACSELIKSTRQHLLAMFEQINFAFWALNASEIYIWIRV